MSSALASTLRCVRRWATSLCGLLQGGGIRCREVTADEYRPLMVEKLLWSSIFWLLSDVLGGLPVRERGGGR